MLVVVFYLNNQVYDNGLEYLARVNYRLKWTNKKKKKKNPKLSWGFAGNLCTIENTNFLLAR